MTARSALQVLLPIVPAFQFALARTRPFHELRGGEMLSIGATSRQPG